jgi:pilus assembly protein CpaC
MKNIDRIMRFGSASFCLAAMLGTSSLSSAQSQEKSFADMISQSVLIPQGAPDSEMLAKVSVAVNFIKKMEFTQASKSINEALQLDDHNSYLHFLNGFVYHLQARQGDAQKNEMAIEGYQMALRLDPGNWIAQEFLGLVYTDTKKFGQAKEQFSAVLRMSPESTVALYGLMVASYVTGDPVTACAMADRFHQYSKEPNARFIRSSVSVYASCGEFDKADQMRLELAKLNHAPGDIERADQRLAQWKAVYQNQTQAQAQPGQRDGTHSATGFIKTSMGNAKNDVPPMQLASAFNVQDAPPAATPASDSPAAEGTPTGVARPDGANDGTPRMVLVDVVLISTEELITTAKGINLLTALQLQFGSTSAPAYSRSYNSATSSDTVLTKTLTIPALAYSLNIANASNGISEVLARPTLAAMEGLPSEFFSGTNLNAGVNSTSSLGATTTIPVDKRFGVKLAVTPNFLPNGMVKLKVDAQRTFLNTNSANNGGFSYQLQIAETTANANVVMRMGDTLVLSGLSEKETSSSRSGVPLLQDMPLLQYLFSSKRTSDYQNSVLILLTPRSPIYTSKVERGPNGAMTDSMKALREKLGFSGRTPSNIESILNHLKTTDLFTQFRQGDVSLERWDRLHSTGDRLQQALDFLYY